MILFCVWSNNQTIKPLLSVFKNIKICVGLFYNLHFCSVSYIYYKIHTKCNDNITLEKNQALYIEKNDQLLYNPVPWFACRALKSPTPERQNDKLEIMIL